MGVILQDGRTGELTAEAMPVDGGFRILLKFTSHMGASEQLLDSTVFSTQAEAETNCATIASRWYPEKRATT